MKCNQCGSENADTAFCVNCGSKLTQPTVQSINQGFDQPSQMQQNTNGNQGFSNQNQNQNQGFGANANAMAKPDDKLGCLFVGLFILFPFAALIYAIVCIDSKPKASKSALIVFLTVNIIGAIIGMIIGFMYVGVFMAILEQSGGVLTALLGLVL